MAIQYINVGATPNDGTGDGLRTAYIKCNNNFAYLNSYVQSSPPGSLTGTVGDRAGMYAYDSSYFYYCFQDYDGSTVIWGQISLAGGSAPGGANTQVQFNDNNTLQGDAGLTYDKSTLTLGVTNMTFPAGSGAFGTGQVLVANGYPTLESYGSGFHGGPEFDWSDSNTPGSYLDNTVYRNTMYLNNGGLFVGVNQNFKAGSPSGYMQFNSNCDLVLDVGNVYANVVSTQTSTVASLPNALLAGAGARFFVTDADTTTFANLAVGGASNAVPVFSDGTNWKIG